MAKIKFMPIQNPIDKLYTDVTGMPFPVSAAVTGGGPQPEPELEFGTLNILRSDPVYDFYTATMTANQDMTGKQVYVQDENMEGFTVRMVPDETDPTTLVLDNDYDGNTFTTEWLAENPTGSAETFIQPGEITGPTAAYSCDMNNAQTSVTIEYSGEGYGEEGALGHYRAVFSVPLNSDQMRRIGDYTAADLWPSGWIMFGDGLTLGLDSDYENPDTALSGNTATFTLYGMWDEPTEVCPEWETLQAGGYGQGLLDIVPEGAEYPIDQVGFSFSWAFDNSYTPECTSPEV